MEHGRSPQRGLLPRLREDLASAFPSLHVIEHGDGTLSVSGTFPVSHDGTVIERFHIEVRLPREYPKRPPVVIETGGRIPRSPERHVNPDGSLCLFVPEEYQLKFPKVQPLVDFLQGPVRDYLLMQLAFERDGKWPFGQRAHGNDGRIEFYTALFGVPDRAGVMRYLDCMAVKQLKGHMSCPCGSGKRLRDCHRREVEELRTRVPRELARQAVAELRK